MAIASIIALVDIGWPDSTKTFTAASSWLMEVKDLSREVFMLAKYSPNDPSSATRPAGRHDRNSDAMAGFAAAHG